jgi:hypothetical protein
MQRIFIASHRVEAYLLVDRLAHAGIKAHIFNEHMSSIAGDVPVDVSQPQVWLDDDARRRVAADVLRPTRRSAIAPGRSVARNAARTIRPRSISAEMRLVVAADRQRG